MRKAAGIMLIIYGVSLMIPYGLIQIIHLPSYAIQNLLFIIPFIIPGAFVVTGGVFCLKKKYWKLCFASALLAVLIMIYLIYGMTGGFSPPPGTRFHVSNFAWWIWFPIWWILLPIITGILPIIFVCIRKREWQEISDSVDGKVSS